MVKKLIKNNKGGVAPVLLFILTIFCCGALYTLLFVEIALPELNYLIPASDGKTFILVMIYGIPAIILVIGGFSLLKEALDRYTYGGP